jgi:predicted porin
MISKQNMASIAVAMWTAVAAGSAALADDIFVAKAPTVAVAPSASAACASAYDFFLTKCPLSWHGVTFFGTVDVGGSYMTHGSPFDRNYPQAVSYVAANGGTSGTSRLSGFFQAPNALSQSNVGVKINEPIAGSWSFIANFQLEFDPYSLLLANGPAALHTAIGTAQNQEAIPQDSSKWGWLDSNNYIGFTNPVYGTVTLGRQNALGTDGIIAYDPTGGAYGFSLIGYSGKTAGAGDTEDARWNTAIKYRENIGNFRLSAMVQPVGLFGGSAGFAAYNANSGAIAGGIGGDIRHLGSGILSLDVIGTWEKDAVNVTLMYPGQVTANGWPTTFPANAALKATISNNTAVTALTKYTFGSWGNGEPPVVGKAAPAPSGPSGIPLTLYAGYEWVQYANPSDPQSSFRDDGYLYLATNAGATVASANGTTIANNAFNANCGSGTGCKNEQFQVIWTGGKYGITKDLDVIGGYYHYIQSTFVNGVNCSNSAAAGNSRCQGWYDAYSLSFDWRFLPKWDAYIGTMYSAAFGGIANGDIARNNLATTAGVRFRF